MSKTEVRRTFWWRTPASSVVGIGIFAQPDPKKNPELIATVVSGEANANLIAAAPDLLEALLRVAQRETDQGPCWCPEDLYYTGHEHAAGCKMARAALARATTL